MPTQALNRERLLKWDASLAIGVDAIDSQHKQLIDLLNGLHYAVRLGRGNELLGRLINGLGNYILKHFCLEEAIMEQTQYPRMHEHQLEHQRFRKRICEFDRAFKAGNVLLTGEIMAYLRDWVRDHIASCDQELGHHLRQLDPG